MTPHLGSGAGQGIEDAYLLSQLLSHPQTTKENIQACNSEVSTCLTLKRISTAGP
jgi:2-polyprenyl-6-methoxyphenol hydroxylase-like FAD-dependent oxidoreductase